MKQKFRYLTGVVLIPLILALIYLCPPPFFTYLIVFIAFFAFAEYLAMFGERSRPAFIFVAVSMLFMVEAITKMGAIFQLSTATVGQVESLFKPLKQFAAILFGSVVLIPMTALIGKDKIETKFKRMLIWSFGFYYFGLTFGFFPLVRHYGNHYHWLTFSLVIPWVCDSAAYFGGRACGRRKFAPAISPKKTWEGAVFGAIFSVIAGLVFGLTLLKGEGLIFVLIVSLFVGILGQFGDLVESLIKRGAGVKDSGNVFPGHGGIFDRTDSLIVSITVVFIALLVKNYV